MLKILIYHFSLELSEQPIYLGNFFKTHHIDSDIKMHCKTVLEKCILKPRVNGHNIVGQQFPTLLDVTCCVRLHTLLHVV